MMCEIPNNALQVDSFAELFYSFSIDAISLSPDNVMQFNQLECESER